MKLSIWKYLKALFQQKAEERMDPKIQLNQIVAYHEEEDVKLREQAAIVLGNRNTLKLRQGRAIKAAEELKKKAKRYALDAAKEKDPDKRLKLDQRAQEIAMDLIAKEQQVKDMNSTIADMEESAKAAQVAVKRNSLTLRRVANERMQLLSKIDQTQMQEQVNKALGIAGKPLDIPSFESIEQSIEERYGLAMGHAELNEGVIFEADHEMDVLADEAAARLKELMEPTEAPQLTEGK